MGTNDYRGLERLVLGSIAVCRSDRRLSRARSERASLHTRRFCTDGWCCEHGRECVRTDGDGQEGGAERRGRIGGSDVRSGMGAEGRAVVPQAVPLMAVRAGAVPPVGDSR